MGQLENISEVSMHKHTLAGRVHQDTSSLPWDSFFFFFLVKVRSDHTFCFDYWKTQRQIWAASAKLDTHFSAMIKNRVPSQLSGSNPASTTHQLWKPGQLLRHFGSVLHLLSGEDNASPEGQWSELMKAKRSEWLHCKTLATYLWHFCVLVWSFSFIQNQIYFPALMVPAPQCPHLFFIFDCCGQHAGS